MIITIATTGRQKYSSDAADYDWGLKTNRARKKNTRSCKVHAIL